MLHCLRKRLIFRFLHIQGFVLGLFLCKLLLIRLKHSIVQLLPCFVGYGVEGFLIFGFAIPLKRGGRHCHEHSFFAVYHTQSVNGEGAADICTCKRLDLIVSQRFRQELTALRDTIRSRRLQVQISAAPSPFTDCVW